MLRQQKDISAEDLFGSLNGVVLSIGPRSTTSPRLTQVEIYFRGKAHAMARPVDAVVNAQLPSRKLTPAPAPQATGINFVELLERKDQASSPDQEHDQDNQDEDKKE